MNGEKKLRMYCFVLNQLGPIHKGIQSAHAIVDYLNNFGGTEIADQWMNIDKTIVMLDGGTYLELQEVWDTLSNMFVGDDMVNVGRFFEPDLGGIMTALCFIADERMFDDEYEEMYGDPDVFFTSHSESASVDFCIATMRNLIKTHRLSR